MHTSVRGIIKNDDGIKASGFVLAMRAAEKAFQPIPE